MESLILALDCSLQSLTLALLANDQVIAEVVEPPQVAQPSSLLLKKIDELLKKSGHALSVITDVLYAFGPGSFTSLRIGLATLQGLFSDSPVKLHVVSSLLLRCLSMEEGGSKNTVSVMKAGRDKFYVGIWDGGKFSEDLMSRAETSTTHDVVRGVAFQRIWREKMSHATSWMDVKLNYQQKAV